jgi:anti-anti-sigma factor
MSDPASGTSGQSLFQVAVRASTDRTAVLALLGEVDIANVSVLGNALSAAAKVGVRHLILDCAELTFLDASGVRTLVAASDDFRARGGTLVLRHASGPVRLAVEATGLGDVFEMPGGARHPESALSGSC